MLGDVTFGQYYNANSFVHKTDPRIKILLLIAYIVAVFLAGNFLPLVEDFLLRKRLVVDHFRAKVVKRFQTHFNSSQKSSSSVLPRALQMAMQRLIVGL